MNRDLALLRKEILQGRDIKHARLMAGSTQSNHTPAQKLRPERPLHHPRIPAGKVQSRPQIRTDRRPTGPTLEGMQPRKLQIRPLHQTLQTHLTADQVQICPQTATQRASSKRAESKRANPESAPPTRLLGDSSNSRGGFQPRLHCQSGGKSNHEQPRRCRLSYCCALERLRACGNYLLALRVFSNHLLLRLERSRDARGPCR